MDKINDKKKFQCPECGECFSTKQNLRRHITRKHKEDVWETVVDSPPMTVNELIDSDPLVSIILDDRGVPDIISVNYQSETETEPIPNDAYLIHLRNEYNKYNHLYRSIDNHIKWQKSNRNIDMDYYVRRHNTKMKYILFKIALLNCNV